MSDVKGFDRAAALRPGIDKVYGLELQIIQAQITQWVTDYGSDGLLAIQWRRHHDGFFEPVLIPQEAERSAI